MKKILDFFVKHRKPLNTFNAVSTTKRKGKTTDEKLGEGMLGSI
jgi:hypothetical protein